jgi:type VI secretion system protein ImpI
LEGERTLKGGSIVLGRAPDCDWVLNDRARLLSRQHCEINLSDDRIMVTDRSSNGIFLNGDTTRLERGRAIEIEHEGRRQQSVRRARAGGRGGAPGCADGRDPP